jgi:hypothetical protein
MGHSGSAGGESGESGAGVEAGCTGLAIHRTVSSIVLRFAISLDSRVAGAHDVDGVHRGRAV